MRKRGFLGLVLVVTLIWATPAAADAISFDPDGAGPLGAVSIDIFDPAPGNSITLSILPVVGDTGTVLFQANLSGASLGGNPSFAGCLGGADCFTFVAAVDVVVTAVGATSVELGLDPNAVTNVFHMYASATNGNNLAGTGFTTGTQILTGSFSTLSSIFTQGLTCTPAATCTPTGIGPIDNLDNFGVNNWPGVFTVVGGGSTGGGSASGGGSFAGEIVINVPSLDTDYFKTSPDAMFFAATSQNVLPFGQVDPSQAFSSNAVANGDVASAPLIGAVNGTNGNTLLQTDANISIETENIPEPFTPLLLGMGVLGFAARRRQLMRRT